MECVSGYFPYLFDLMIITVIEWTSVPNSAHATYYYVVYLCVLLDSALLIEFWWRITVLIGVQWWLQGVEQ